MEIRIGDIKFGGDSKYQIEPGISGLDSADIRTGDGLYAGVDGGYISSQLYGFRVISFTGFYVAGDCDERDSLRETLLRNIHIRYLYPVFVRTFTGKYYFTEGYLTDIKAEIDSPRANEFQITITCPDPVLYDGGNGINSDSAWMEQTIYKEKAGGFDIEYTSPVQWVSGQMATLIDNIGTIDTYPIITLRGNYHNPKITNLTTNQFIHIQRNILDTQEVVIDMKKRIITLKDAGGNITTIASNRTINSSWWTLTRGENKIILETDDINDTNYAMIKYKQGYEGF